MNPPNTGPRTFTIVVEESLGERLDSFLSAHPEVDLSRTKVQKLLELGAITVDGAAANKKDKPKKGSLVTITIPAPTVEKVVAEDIPVEIIYEDDYLAVVNKPAGMVTHPGRSNYSGTLVNAIMFQFEKLATGSDNVRPGIVHRLDKDTSGLLLIAKEDNTLRLLQEGLKEHRIARTYIALVHGHMPETVGDIDLPIGRSNRNRVLMAVNGLDSRQATTSFKRIEKYRSYDLLEVRLRTGRTHQIRVHFSHLGHPVFGDADYGGRESYLGGMFAPERLLAKKLLRIIDRQALHSHKIAFVHPVSGEEISLEAELPSDFQSLLDLLNIEGI